MLSEWNLRQVNYPRIVVVYWAVGSHSAQLNEVGFIGWIAGSSKQVDAYGDMSFPPLASSITFSCHRKFCCTSHLFELAISAIHHLQIFVSQQSVPERTSPQLHQQTSRSNLVTITGSSSTLLVILAADLDSSLLFSQPSIIRYLRCWWWGVSSFFQV